ncbi:hypothetical protein GGX14DRAFT_578163 [Mycena pura]|uniref:Uncharacterized protein n=1 Tax=Mycena pura TaxID=153505 RepID=A0AAD6UU76_9AGAR|nr:hypothetical protein GGX14DRAFT_578163 [Mycena pura]
MFAIRLRLSSTPLSVRLILAFFFRPNVLAPAPSPISTQLEFAVSPPSARLSDLLLAGARFPFTLHVLGALASSPTPTRLLESALDPPLARAECTGIMCALGALVRPSSPSSTQPRDSALSPPLARFCRSVGATFSPSPPGLFGCLLR